jgi:hypothetical protein
VVGEGVGDFVGLVGDRVGDIVGESNPLQRRR